MKKVLLATIASLAMATSAYATCPPKAGQTFALALKTNPSAMVGVVKLIPEISTSHIPEDHAQHQYKVSTWRYGKYGFRCAWFSCWYFRIGAVYGTAIEDDKVKCLVIAADDVKAFR